MPNTKIHIDRALLDECRPALLAALVPLRALFCDRLAVGPAACQLAVVAVDGLSDQPPVNVELSILPAPARTRDRLLALAADVRALLGPVTGAHVAVRIAQLDPATYLALK